MDVEAVVTLASAYKSTLCHYLGDHTSVYILPVVFQNAGKKVFFIFVQYVVELFKMLIRNRYSYCHYITNEKCFFLIQNLDSTKMGSLAVV